MLTRYVVSFLNQCANLSALCGFPPQCKLSCSLHQVQVPSWNRKSESQRGEGERERETSVLYTFSHIHLLCVSFHYILICKTNLITYFFGSVLRHSRPKEIDHTTMFRFVTSDIKVFYIPSLWKKSPTLPSCSSTSPSARPRWRWCWTALQWGRRRWARQGTSLPMAWRSWAEQFDPGAGETTRPRSVSLFNPRKSLWEGWLHGRYWPIGWLVDDDDGDQESTVNN